MDVDIDVPSLFERSKIFPQHTIASIVKDRQLIIHSAGLYLQTVPKDPVTGLSAVPYNVADELGYTKIDFLHLSFLDLFQSKEEVRALSKIEPDWTLLEDPTVVGTLFQIHRHHRLLQQVKPRSVQELADCIALIRPTKKRLLRQYLKNKPSTRPILYQRAENEKSTFRRSHAIAYALIIVIQLNLIRAGVTV